MILLIDRRNCQRWQAASITSPNRERRESFSFFVLMRFASSLYTFNWFSYLTFKRNLTGAIKLAMKAITDYFNPHRVKYSEMHNKKDIGWRRNQSVNYQQLPSGTQRIFPRVSECFRFFLLSYCRFADG